MHKYHSLVFITDFSLFYVREEKRVWRQGISLNYDNHKKSAVMYGTRVVQEICWVVDDASGSF